MGVLGPFREHEQLLEAALTGDVELLVEVWVNHLNEKEARVSEGLTRALEESARLDGDGGVDGADAG